MPNTLTGLIPVIYDAFDITNRELVGFIPSVARNSSAERAAVGQSVTWPLNPTPTGFNVAPAMTIPEPTDMTVTPTSMTITKAKGYEFGVTGEESRSLSGSGPGWRSIQAGAIANAIRLLTNEMELDLATAAMINACRAHGTAGTTPFGSNDLTDLAQTELILNDNGTPMGSRSMVMNNAAAAKFKTMNNLTRVNEAGTSMTLRTGELMDIYGMSMKASGANPRFVKGTAAGATTNTTGYAVGVTVITLASAGTGEIKQGDVITFAGDTNKYVVASGDASVAGGGTITLAAPGLRQAIPAAATAITVGNNYSANIAFDAGAIHLATRAPALPEEGDNAYDRIQITDPFSGISYEFAQYRGYRKVRYEVTAAWGVLAWKRENIALLLG